MVEEADVTSIIEVLFDSRRTMASKKTKERIRDEVRADQARYDDVTRRLKERIARGRALAQPRRERS